MCSLSANQLNKLEAEDTLVAAIKFVNGGLGTIEATTAARPEDFEASISIIGEKGIAEIGGVALNEIKKWKFVEEEKGDRDVISKFFKCSYRDGFKPLNTFKRSFRNAY